MRAFGLQQQTTPPRTGPTTIQLDVPEKTPDEMERRGSAAAGARPIGARRTSGGLSGQYSTSMPSGGYFPPAADEPEENLDESEYRRRQRDEKRRALKAAWGTDTRMYASHSAY